MVVRSRGFCFTINNYTDDDIAECMALYDLYDAVYLIVAFEVGDEGTKHIQAYVKFKNQIKFKVMKGRLSRAHIEGQKGSDVQAIVYCMKDLDYYEVGVRPRQGKRSDLDVIKYDILKKKSMVDIADDYFSQWCMYRRSFDVYKEMKVRYDTVVYAYELKDIPDIYKMNLDNSLFFDRFDLGCYRLMHEYCSKRYQYIFVEKSLWLDNLKGFIDIRFFSTGYSIWLDLDVITGEEGLDVGERL